MIHCFRRWHLVLTNDFINRSNRNAHVLSNSIWEVSPKPIARLRHQHAATWENTRCR
jgi:hypothetical protein